MHKEYRDTFSPGVSLEYYGTFGLVFGGNSTPYSYGVTLNVTVMGKGYYHVDSKPYEILSPPGAKSGFNGNLLPGVPFYGPSIVQVSEYSGNLTAAQYPIIGLLFPRGNQVNSTITNFSLSTSPQNMAPGGYLGFPDYYFGNVSYSLLEISYVHFGHQMVISYLLASLGPPTVNSSINLLASVFPDFGFNSSAMQRAVMLILNIGYGNAVPAQDWPGWIL
ncbi:hypothetical protein [Thermogymnomonas acidicola]|nr:hypothetical protein [Thermogymnomonas acidicola]